MQHVLDKLVRRAHQDGSYGIAYEIARDELDGLAAAEGLERTLEIVDQDPVLYDAMAVAWIQEAIIDRRLMLYTVGWAADRFDEARKIQRRDRAERALRKWVE